MNLMIPIITMGAATLFTSCISMPSNKSTRGSNEPASPALTQFVLPRVALQNANFETALEQIVRSYSMLAGECSTRPRTIRPTVTGTPHGTITADYHNVTTARALRAIGAQVGLETKLNGRSIEFVPLPKGGSLKSRSRQVPPTFMVDLTETTGLVRNTNDSMDKFQSYLGRALRKQNLFQDPRSRATYLPSSSTLKVAATESDHYRLNAFLDSKTFAGPRVELHIQRILFKSDPGLADGLFTAARAERWLQRADKIRGSRIQLLAPPVREAIGSDGHSSSFPSRGGSGTWVGTHTKAHLRSYGSGALVTFDYEHRVAGHPRGELTATSNKDLSLRPRYRSARTFAEAREYATANNLPVTRSRTAKFRRVLPPGTGLIVKTKGNSAESEYLVIFLKRFDRKGQAIKHFIES